MWKLEYKMRNSHSGNLMCVSRLCLPENLESAKETAKTESYDGKFTLFEISDPPRGPKTEQELLRSDVDALTLALADMIGGAV